jgi:hypothetical protein
MKMEQTECSETSAYKIQTPGNYPEENIQQIRGCFFGNTLQFRQFKVEAGGKTTFQTFQNFKIKFYCL